MPTDTHNNIYRKEKVLTIVGYILINERIIQIAAPFESIFFE